jgi:iron uptake system EfeUOB component EfeO/EfeM
MVFKHLKNDFKIVILFTITIISCSFFTKKNNTELSSELPISIKYHTKQLISIFDQSITLTENNFTQEKCKQLKSNYFLARNHYKKIECFIEYFSSFDVKYFINGSLIKKSDLEIGSRVVDPHGFQVIEEQLFGTDSINQKILLTELQLLDASFKAFEKKLMDLKLNDSQIIETMQFELIRISSLTLNGYDALSVCLSCRDLKIYKVILKKNTLQLIILRKHMLN